MNYDQINFHLEHSTSVKLLRSDYASLALSFFYFAFKKQNRTQIPYDELKGILKSYLDGPEENRLESGEDIEKSSRKYVNTPDHYLGMWCSENHRFIRKFYDNESDGPITELTYDSERALEWM